uniref:Uncharacterized protein n=1 Tax=Timema bartmani TaxID=61472 RepID=A0A7R9F166_9NEOP|nr:unnamed protein product [Timema bartmani]
MWIQLPSLRHMNSLTPHLTTSLQFSSSSSPGQSPVPSQTHDSKMQSPYVRAKMCTCVAAELVLLAVAGHPVSYTHLELPTLTFDCDTAGLIGVVSTVLLTVTSPCRGDTHGEVALLVLHSSLMSSDRMKPRSGCWAVGIDFLQEAANTCLSSHSNFLSLFDSPPNNFATFDVHQQLR